MCPLEVELGPQSLPWLLLFILRNFVIVPGLLFKGIWAGEGGRKSAHLSDYEKAGVCRADPAQGCSGRQVTEIIGNPSGLIPLGKEHSAARVAHILSGPHGTSGSSAGPS